jgi:ABC-type transporter Mla maintaining outer membrane lipid asymmetry ATPase subunit MlaF
MKENRTIPAIEMRGVHVGAMRDALFTVVEDVNWSVAAGEFWVVAGPEYSGKSDLLMLAAGLMPPTRGSCMVFGCDTRYFGEADPAERLRVGLVFQGGNLFNGLTIAENVALPLQYRHDLTAAAAVREVQALLALLELMHVAGLAPADVAANWRQRAALARALILRPEVLLLDNPLAGLGARHRHWWLRFLEQLSRGHEPLGGQPMTIVVAADDLRPWQDSRRKFALMRGKRFNAIGGWDEVETASDPVLKELLVAPVESTG